MRRLGAVLAAVVVAATGAACDSERKPGPSGIDAAAAGSATTVVKDVTARDTAGSCALLSAEDVSRALGIAVAGSLEIPEDTITPPGMAKPMPAPSCNYRLSGVRASEGVRVRVAAKGAEDLWKRIEPRTTPLVERLPLDFGANLGFEAGEGGALAEPWRSGQSKSMEAVRDCEVKDEGSCSFRVRTTAAPRTGGFTEDTIPIGREGGGFAYQCQPAGNAAGTSMVVTGRLQPALESGSARLFVYTVLSEGRFGPGAESEPVGGTGPWTEVSASVAVPNDHDLPVCVAVYSDGKGSAWFDGLRVLAEKQREQPEGVKMRWQAEGTTLWVTKGDKAASIQIVVERGLARPAVDVARELADRVLAQL